MLRTTVYVDLPSEETQRRMGPIEWTRSLFGADIDLKSGKEELTISALSLMKGLLHAFETVGIHDVISLIVDKKVVYLDKTEVPDDIELMMQAAEQKGILDRPFRQMHLALSHKEGGLHAILDIKIESQVLLGESEMQIELSGRAEALKIKAGESAAAYADRVRDFAKAPEPLEQHRHLLTALADRLGDAMRRHIVGAKIRTEATQIQVIQPTEKQVGGFRQLAFEDQVDEPRYRPTPSKSRKGAYEDPYFYYYYDPYYALTSWLVVDAMTHHHRAWHQTTDTHVVDGDGTPLFEAENAHLFTEAFPGAKDVSFSDDTGLSVSDSIPGSDSSGGLFGLFSSGADDGGGGWFSSDGGGFDGGDSGSSCGASCGSSCGSSCGGGCGGGCS